MKLSQTKLLIIENSWELLVVCVVFTCTMKIHFRHLQGMCGPTWGIDQLFESRRISQTQQSPKRENRKLHKRTHAATMRIVNLLSHNAQLAHNSVDLSKWRARPGKLGVAAARCSKPRVHVRSGGAWGTPGTPTSLREHRAHHVRMCAPEHTSARCARVCTFQGITTHWKPVVLPRSGDVRVLRPVYLLCSNTSADISYKSTFF